MGDISTNFSTKEFACQCGCGFNTPEPGLIFILECVRSYFSKPIYITSGCRCKEHNSTIPGHSPVSMHIKGMAADFFVNSIDSDDVANFLENNFSDRFGIGRYTGRTHLDIRTKPARWDNRGINKLWTNGSRK